MQEAQVKELKTGLTNPLALSRAKDHAGISDRCARTLLLDMLPDSSWVPSATALQKARTSTNQQMQVRTRQTLKKRETEREMRESSLG
jgi:hypothetical protein